MSGRRRALAMPGMLEVLYLLLAISPACGAEPPARRSPHTSQRFQIGTLSLWGERWIPAGQLYFVSADGRKHLGFAEDRAGRIVGLTGGSWRVLERVR
ncbi:MAG: hypothetical protein ABIY46_16340 [Gemmatimonadales bacterium]